ncbi:DUF2087 domain-containing protein [Streptomyces torulosus]|uniref:DUF2087 domain-containing protein n=1 Tax=Streptomyces torulosus TaxID=68276 RepID=UPI0006EB44F2|nr:DUF2087 domain-containing protein [Streptomyces torulosus]
MATDQLIRLFTDEDRARAFAAVALGADTPAKVGATAGLSPKDTAMALRRLQAEEVISATGAGLSVAYEHFRERAREERVIAESGTRTPDHGSGDRRAESVLRTFVRDGRLVRLPAQWQRKLVVLRHIAERTFESGVEYPEREVNEKLRAWCTDGPVDHVTLRRYLVDLGHLRRQYGFYWRPEGESS